MRLPGFLFWRLVAWSQRVRLSELHGRAPDFVIGDEENPYLRRWWIIPRNRWFNIYLHEIRRSDDDRALHDHPWLNCTILLMGCYVEHRILAGGIRPQRLVRAGDIIFRRAKAAHRLETLPGKHAVSLFITGPVIRHWGFHCPDAGWRHWEDFTAPEAKGRIGRGCGEMGDVPPRRGGGRLFDFLNPRRG
jgi:hypothetical protein